MEGYIYFFRILEVVLAIILILISSVSIIIGFVLKKSNHQNIIKSTVIMSVGFLILYLLFFAGEYSIQNIKKNTIDRLMNLSIESINMEVFSLPESNESTYISEDLIGEYNFELKNSQVRGSVRISHYYDDTKNYEPYYSFCKFMAKEYTDNDSYVLIEPRESDRDFFKFPLISSYMSSILVVNNNYLIEITYLELKNDPQTVEMILDSIIK